MIILQEFAAYLSVVPVRGKIMPDNRYDNFF